MEVDEIIPVTDGECSDHKAASIVTQSYSRPLFGDFSTIEEAFGAKHLADLGQDEEDFTVFHWDVSHWARLEKRLTSPIFECGGHKW